MKKEDLLENIYKTKEHASKLNKRLGNTNIMKADLESTLAAHRKKQNFMRSEIQFKSSRHKVLKEMEQNFEGYNRSVKTILAACRRSDGFGSGIYGALAQLINVDPKYETAIEMALGSALQNIVTASEEDAKKAIDYLKVNKLGRATFLPISSIRGKYFNADQMNAINKADGLCGIASDLVSCHEEFKVIILSLLGKVVIVNNIDSGIEMSRRFSYGFRIVTLEGDILNT